MGYHDALEKSWNAVAALTADKTVSIAMLSDTYTVDLSGRTVFSASCNVPAKDYISILVLHYLAKKLKLDKMPALTGEWVDFSRLDGGEAYYPTFKKRTIDHVLKKYGSNPEALLNISERMPAARSSFGDAGMAITVFDGVKILVTLWKGDEEFGPGANILFDKSISKIFCTEDIVVLTEIVAHAL